MLYVMKLHGEAGIEVPGDLKELPGKLEEFQSSISAPTSKVSAFDNFKLDIQADLLALPKQVSSINAQLSKLIVLDALPNLLNKVVEASDRFKNVIDKASHKTGDESVPLAGQVGTHLADREKNTQQATITQLFQRRHAKDAANANLNKEPTIPKTTISISSITTTTALIIPTTLLFQFPFIPVLQRPPLKLRGIKSWTKARKQCLMRKLLKKSLKVTLKLKSDLQDETLQMNQDEIEKQKGIEQAVKADAAKFEIKQGKKYLIERPR
ncbi:hypothetical protein Tco_1574772, partial [Tanacetum coccineum]